MPVPQFSPMPLARLPEPFDHPDWLFEIKYDGFRVLAYIDRDCRLVSRNNYTYKAYGELAAEVAGTVRKAAVLDGEIVCLDGQGRPRFNDLLFRRGTPYFYAFDLLWCEGRDLRERPLVERKRRLRRLIPPTDSRLLYVEHHHANGRELFRAACEADLEGLVAKLAYENIRLTQPRGSRSRIRPIPK